ncbi:hypothetical protein LRP52_40880 [Photobacterium sp. ZSDE20]|uniref:Uncharacterized protein n=1 Tax=Photobacterium pectinilyticum TaxID=2906793 RepID=A0ABT1NAB1_9GAMM|nr:hypothetical protein [Photobacterium sp. ZSDE20]MCQ1060794.1 hypothetical protein [Photobacterium sp. ZSDE20]MDD1828540.1 hypothetical protein [Photobacterium sp. ZSDE20]
MAKWLIKSLPVSQLHILPSPLRDESQHTRLKALFSTSSNTFFSRLMDAIIPVPVMSFKRHYYPLRHIPELTLLAQYYPDEKISVVVKGRANSQEQIQQHSATAQWFDLLHSHDCKDLFGLQTEWLHAFNFRPLLNQKQLCELLECERTTLYKRHDRLLPRWQPCDEAIPALPPVDFDSLTAHIPDK